jgi:hypothetical protein
MFYYSLYFFDIEIDYLNLFLKLEQMKKEIYSKYLWTYRRIEIFQNNEIIDFQI